VRVCIERSAGKCAPQQLIVGTSTFDGIRGTQFADTIKARADNDHVFASGGGPDRVNCGAGKRDHALVDRDDTVKACEGVRRR
jgi:hypothetical protein